MTTRWQCVIPIAVITCVHPQVLRPRQVYRLQFYSQYIPKHTMTHSLPFMEAPAAHEAIHGEPLPRVCIVFCSPAGISQVKSVHAMCAQQSMQTFTHCVNVTLGKINGYVCKERNGIHMLAFHNVRPCVLLKSEIPCFLSSCDKLKRL